MCDSEQYLPHREAEPVRRCAGCSALLSTGNQTESCWSCEPRWSYLVVTPLEQRDAFASLMESELGDEQLVSA